MHLAYIDGGTGSLALQLLIAGAASLVYAVNSKLGLIRKILHRKRPRPGE